MNKKQLHRILKESINEVTNNEGLKNVHFYIDGYSVIVDYEQTTRPQYYYDEHPGKVYVEMWPFFNDVCHGWFKKRPNGKVNMHQVRYYFENKIAQERAARLHGWRDGNKVKKLYFDDELAELDDD